MLTYEQQLDRNHDWALREGSMHFEEKSAVHQTLVRIAKRLTELHIPYAVVGGMAMFVHGFRRFTEDVDILVTAQSMQAIREQLEGLGYVAPAGTRMKLRDTQTQVKIEFLITGGYPGDGLPKPVSFPDPKDVSVEIGGINYLNLPALVELKLASGLTGGVNRMKDLADVVELIRILKLPRAFVDQLNDYVRDKFIELWQGVQDAPPED